MGKKTWAFVIVPSLAICWAPAAVAFAGYYVYRLGEMGIEQCMAFREHRKYDYPSLGKRLRRRRALTLPLAQPAIALPMKRRRETSAQNSSPLFAKLPTEVRMMIWEYLLAGNDIKINYSLRNSNAPVEAVVASHWWAVVRTCRIAYSESIELLYSQSRFKIVNGTLFKFRQSILTHRWNEIRFLHLQHLFEPIYKRSRKGCVIKSRFTGKILGTEDWPYICKALEALPKLRELMITVTDPRGWLTAEKIAMLKGVKVEGSFQVVVSRHYKQRAMFTDENNVTFNISRKKNGQTEDEVEISRM